ncbi:hypothetical protein MTO96_023564 [Rhipicephalus appendiculatus]
MADYGASEYKPEFRWVACRANELPENAVPGGDDTKGDVTYIGRATYADEVIPGKVVPSRGFCYIPHGGAEHLFRDCQVDRLADEDLVFGVGILLEINRDIQASFRCMNLADNEHAIALCSTDVEMLAVVAFTNLYGSAWYCAIGFR